MQRSHDFKMEDYNFSGYLLNFRKSLFVPANLNVTVGDTINMFEFNDKQDILTGRKLTFTVRFIDCTPGLIGIGNVWLLDMDMKKDLTVDVANIKLH